MPPLLYLLVINPEVPIRHTHTTQHHHTPALHTTVLHLPLLDYILDIHYACINAQHLILARKRTIKGQKNLPVQDLINADLALTAYLRSLRPGPLPAPPTTTQQLYVLITPQVCQTVAST